MRYRALAAALLLPLLAGCRAPEQRIAQSNVAAELHYSPAENLERMDVALLQTAHRSIDFAAYSLTDLVVANALMDAARGVHVRVYRDQTQFRGEAARATKASRSKRKRVDNDEDEDGVADNDLIARLSAAPNVEIRVKHSHTLMHLKSYCVDGAFVRSGSANFSPTGEKRQDNDLVILCDADSVRTSRQTSTQSGIAQTMSL
ncbi:MAG: phosphatidylserine synthase [Acidobacteria bacterium]|nr:phosphatidylserine synthase [Acidobacteriota bacterium]